MALFKCEKYQTLEKLDLLLLLPLHVRQILTLNVFFGRQNCVNYAREHGMKVTHPLSVAIGGNCTFKVNGDKPFILVIKSQSKWL